MIFKIYPNAKRYDEKTFEGKNFIAKCATFRRRKYGFAHECEIKFYIDDYRCKVNGLVKYCNRTWENFKYECVLKNAIENLPPDKREQAYKELIEDTVNKTKGEVESFLAEFKSEYAKLPDSTKEKLKNIEVKTEEQAQELLCQIKCLNVLSTMMEYCEENKGGGEEDAQN